MIWTVVLAGAICAQANSPAKDDLAAQVQRLVRDLDSAELSQRTAAEEQLVQLGPAALEFLPTAEKQSASAREALERIAASLQRAAAAEHAKATTVTLEADAMPLSKVLAEIERQTGNRIVDGRQELGQEVADAALDIDFHETPFWLALDDVLDQAELTAYLYDEPGAIQLRDRAEQVPASAGVATHGGPLRIEAVRLSTSRDLRRPELPMLEVAIEIAWEPRLKPLTIQHRLSAVTLDGGQEIVPEQPHAEQTATARAGAVEISVPLPAPPRAVQRVSLRGDLSMLLSGNAEKFEFDNLKQARKVEKKKAAVTVTLDQVRRDGEVWVVQGHVRFDQPGDALDSHLDWYRTNQAYLLAEDGTQIEPATAESLGRTDEEFGFSFIFAPEQDIEKLKFVYETPASIHQIPVEYQLKDLPLP